MISSVMNSAIDVITWLGGKLLRAQRLPQQTQHDRDPHEAGGHQQDGRRQAHHGQHRQHFKRRGNTAGAEPFFRSADAAGQFQRKGSVALRRLGRQQAGRGIGRQLFGVCGVV